MAASVPGPQAESGQRSTDAAAATDGQSAAPTPTIFDPATLTIEGLAAAWQLPFYALGKLLHLLRVTPDPEPVYAVGRRRARELAAPSYVLYEHAVRNYLKADPANDVVAAGCVTGLNAVGILPDVIEAVLAARQKAARAAKPGRSDSPSVAGGKDATR